MAVKANYLPAVLEQKAKNGDAQAASTLYHLHLFGDDFFALPANPKKAILCLFDAANILDSEELKNVATKISRNGFTYSKEDVESIENLLQKESSNDVDTVARELKEKAFIQTNMKPESHNYTSVMKSTPKSRSDSNATKEEAIPKTEPTHKNEQGRQLYELGMSHIQGLEGEKNLLKGLNYLKQAADLGDEKAIAELDNIDDDSAFFKAIEEGLDKRA